MGFVNEFVDKALILRYNLLVSLIGVRCRFREEIICSSHY